MCILETGCEQSVEPSVQCSMGALTGVYSERQQRRSTPAWYEHIERDGRVRAERLTAHVTLRVCEREDRLHQGQADRIDQHSIE